MDVLRFASTQSPPNLRCKPLSPAAANYTTVKAAADVHVRRATSGALIRAALSRPEVQGLSATSTAAAEKQSLRRPELRVLSPGSLTSEPGGVIPNLACHHGNESYSYRAVEYLTAILSSNKVYDVALESPLQLASKLTARLGNNIWLKREDLQPGEGGGANVLVDLQVGRNEIDEFMQQANNLGYEHAVETCNQAFQLFI